MEKELRTEIIKECQFPYKKRKVQYQSIEDENMPGIRNMEYRYAILHLPDFFTDKTVLDLGCSMGIVCIEARKRGAYRCVGLDNKLETIKTANKYLNSKKYKNVKLIHYDINDGVWSLISLIGKQKFDYVFALSILKHVNQVFLFDIINYYTKEICWLEGHNKQNKDKLRNVLEQNTNFKSVEFLGHTSDRGTRPVFRLA